MGYNVDLSDMGIDPDDFEDPLFEEARNHTDAVLDGLPDDIPQADYNRMWQEEYERQVARLTKLRDEEIDDLPTLHQLDEAGYDLDDF